MSQKNSSSPVKGQEQLKKSSSQMDVSQRSTMQQKKNSQPKFLPIYLNEETSGDMMRIEQRIFNQEGAENYAQINSIVNYLRKYRQNEEKRKEKRESENSKSPINAGAHTFIRDPKSLNVNNPRVNVTTDQDGKPIVFKNLNTDRLPAIQAQVTQVKQKDLQDKKLRNISNQQIRSLKGSKSQRQLLNITKQLDPYYSKVGLVEKADSQNLLSELNIKPHLMKNSFMDEANQTSLTQHTNLKTQKISKEAKDILDIQQKLYQVPPNQMTLNDYKRNQQKFIIDMTKVNPEMDQNLLMIQEINKQIDTLVFTNEQDGLKISLVQDNNFENLQQESKPKFKSKYLRNMTNKEQITKNQNVDILDLFNDQQVSRNNRLNGDDSQSSIVFNKSIIDTETKNQTSMLPQIKSSRNHRINASQSNLPPLKDDKFKLKQLVDRVTFGQQLYEQDQNRQQFTAKNDMNDQVANQTFGFQFPKKSFALNQNLADFMNKSSNQQDQPGKIGQLISLRRKASQSQLNKGMRTAR
ncbi:UNKNOWN [Stylonychia lemnae]|uniref:Uncharacterized protein n=1 Tax=Stylonychia lemnae TaxID=5949 RepID=A0A078B7K2_STYLE|nr:UNKNOWN [Stylonychia lemnae]|eukprot:CDW90201.1 UNKNOWN [Stylonychia lemnae]